MHGRTELLDHADRLVADREAARDRVLALQDMDVGPADRRRRDLDQRVERPDFRDRLLVQHDPAGLDKNRGFHLGHGWGSVAAFMGFISVVSSFRMFSPRVEIGMSVSLN